MTQDEINQALKESNLDVDAMISNIKEIKHKKPKANVTNFPNPQWELDIENLKHLVQIEKELKKIDNGVNYK